MITFRLVTDADLPMLERWLDAPRNRRWYDEPHMADNLNDPRVDPFIVLQDGTPRAYLQSYDIHAWPNHHLGFLPRGARGLDTFIGDEAAMGRGFGPAYLAAFVAGADGVPAFGIDPDPDNTAAIRAYEKVGFTRHHQVETPWGPSLCMALFRQPV